ncbi:MAG: tRNA lysidine(34) synthetase TilS [Bacteroidia bacterium]|nr:tRNA lysidine(34) synthetase TilS [Bacteroidia bacterium]
MLTKLKSFIEKNRLFNKSDQIGLAISGGRDSVCAAYMLNELKISFLMVHVNFDLRGKESEDDQKFIEQLSEKLTYCKGIQAIKENAKVYANNNNLSIQEAAREIRYSYFDKLKQSNHFDKLITAHHQNDLVETFFINLYRKSGINGLKSIPIKRGYVIRPFLAFSANEIHAYVSKNSIEYREDSSNQSFKYLRNTIRNKVIPPIVEFMPRFLDNTVQSIDILKAENDTLDYLLKREIKKITSSDSENLYITKKQLLSFPHPSVILYRILDKYLFNFDQCEQIIACLNGISGKIFCSDTHQLVVDREQIILNIKNKNSIESITIEKEGNYSFSNYFISLKRINEWKYSTNKKEEIIQIPPHMFPLTVRNWKRGDRFTPLGMKGSKLLSDFFIDQKINVFKKNKTPLLCSNDNVLWVLGYQISDLVKVSGVKDVYCTSFNLS